MQGHDVLMSSGDDAGSPDWATPPEFFERLVEEFGEFSLDAAATKANTKVPCCYYTKKDNALEQPWKGRQVFCNPPYGRGIGAWVEKARAEAAIQKNTIVMLLPARTDTRWFHEVVVPDATAIYLVRGRIKFRLPGKKNSATFPSMVVVFGRLDSRIYRGKWAVL